MLKVLISLFSFVFSYVFLPDPVAAAEPGRLPVFKPALSVNPVDEGRKQTKRPLIKVAEKGKKDPLPAVKLPSAWYKFFFNAPPSKKRKSSPKKTTPKRVEIALPIRKKSEPSLSEMRRIIRREAERAKEELSSAARLAAAKATPEAEKRAAPLLDKRAALGKRAALDAKISDERNGKDAGNKKDRPGVKVAIPLATRIPLPPPITKWENSEILAARDKCQKLLAGVDKKVKPVKPIRHNACGTPAPLKVAGLLQNSDAGISLAPAATMNCAMTARLALWVEKDLQRLAEKHLGSPVRMIHNMASYSCRHRYNDLSRKISQHALANALDIGGFTLANGETISVLKHWDDEEAPEKSAFLKAVHATACKRFIVVLGPEANAAHKNHFHFDLGRYRVCE